MANQGKPPTSTAARILGIISAIIGFLVAYFLVRYLMK
jgi:hypothetical protein